MKNWIKVGVVLVVAILCMATTTLINLTYQVTGILPHANGGTDVSSPGTSGKVLTSNGTNWTASSHIGSQRIFTGTVTMPISTVAAASCSASTTTISTPGASRTTDVINITAITDPSGISKWMTVIYWFDVSNNANFKYCNASAVSVSTGTTLTFNMEVIR
jgi:hypothetical protein